MNNINWKSWQTWAVLLAVIIVAVCSFVAPSLNITGPSDYTPMVLILWYAAFIFKILTTLGVLGVAGFGIKKSYDFAMAQRAGGVAAGAAPYTYTTADIAVLLQRTPPSADRLQRAEDFVVAISNPSIYGLRACPRENRWALAKAMCEQAVALLVDAWTWKTKITTIPAAGASWTASSFELIKEYQAANGNICGRWDYDMIKMLFSDITEMESTLEGIGKLEGQTIDWSGFDGRNFCPVDVGQYWSSLILVK